MVVLRDNTTALLKANLLTHPMEMSFIQDQLMTQVLPLLNETVKLEDAQQTFIRRFAAQYRLVPSSFVSGELVFVKCNLNLLIITCYVSL